MGDKLGLLNAFLLNIGAVDSRPVATRFLGVAALFRGFQFLVFTAYSILTVQIRSVLHLTTVTGTFVHAALFCIIM